MIRSLQRSIQPTNDRAHRPVAWLVFGLYVCLGAAAIFHHELWGDEVHSWNIAKASNSFSDLVAHTRYEGHPLLWYTCLFCITKFTHDPFYMQCLHLVICCGVGYVLIFYAGFSFLSRVMILGGYYFAYEYLAISRNYAPGVLLALLICMVLRRKSGYQVPLYYVLLCLLSNTHLLALLLAISLHVYFLVSSRREGVSGRKLLVHVLLGGLVLLPAVYFIFPPGNSGLNVDFWLRAWSRDQFFVIMQAPLKALSPIPAWWEYHAWNTHTMIEGRQHYPFLKLLIPLSAAILVCAACFVLWRHKKSLLLFVTNLALTSLIALIFPLTTARYVGFIYIGFIVSLWLCRDEGVFDRTRKSILYALLGLQVAGGMIALQKDLSKPFSGFNEIGQVTKQIPPGQQIVTDYWCLNYLCASLDKPFYCIGYNREKTFLLWDQEIRSPQALQAYAKGIGCYFKQHAIPCVYLVTNSSREELLQSDSTLFKTYNVAPLAKTEDCIEKHSRIYVYKVSGDTTAAH